MGHVVGQIGGAGSLQQAGAQALGRLALRAGHASAVDQQNEAVRMFAQCGIEQARGLGGVADIAPEIGQIALRPWRIRVFACPDQRLLEGLAPDIGPARGLQRKQGQQRHGEPDGPAPARRGLRLAALRGAHQPDGQRQKHQRSRQVVAMFEGEFELQPGAFHHLSGEIEAHGDTRRSHYGAARPARQRGKDDERQDAEHGQQRGRRLQQPGGEHDVVVEQAAVMGARQPDVAQIRPHNAAFGQQTLQRREVAPGHRARPQARQKGGEIAQHRQRGQTDEHPAPDEKRAPALRDGRVLAVEHQRLQHPGQYRQQRAVLFGKHRQQCAQRQREAHPHISRAPAPLRQQRPAMRVAPKPGEYKGGGEHGHALHHIQRGAHPERVEQPQPCAQHAHPGGGLPRQTERPRQRRTQTREQYAVEQVKRHVGELERLGRCGPVAGIEQKGGERQRPSRRPGKTRGEKGHRFPPCVDLPIVAQRGEVGKIVEQKRPGAPGPVSQPGQRQQHRQRSERQHAAMGRRGAGRRFVVVHG